MDPATRKMVIYGLLGLILAGSAIAVFRVAPQVVPIGFLAKDGSISVYFNTIPSDIQSNQGIANPGLQPIPQSSNILASKAPFNITSLSVTIDSVKIHKSGTNDTDWMSVPNRPMTINLLTQTSVSVFIASFHVPAENVTMIELHVSNANAMVKDSAGVISARVVVVSSDSLKIPLNSGATVKAQMSTDVVAYRPHIVIEGNDQIRLTPVLSVVSVRGPK